MGRAVQIPSSVSRSWSARVLRLVRAAGRTRLPRPNARASIERRATSRAAGPGHDLATYKAPRPATAVEAPSAPMLGAPISLRHHRFAAWCLTGRSSRRAAACGVSPGRASRTIVAARPYAARPCARLSSNVRHQRDTPRPRAGSESAGASDPTPRQLPAVTAARYRRSRSAGPGLNRAMCAIFPSIEAMCAGHSACPMPRSLWMAERTASR